MSHPRKMSPPLPDAERLRQRRQVRAGSSIEMGRPSRHVALAVACVLAVSWQIAACRAEQLPAQPLAAGDSHAPMVGTNAASEATAPPATQAIPGATPLATAAAIQLAGWSPDSRWLAYRESTLAQVEAAAGALPEATWMLYDALAETTCSLSDIGPDWQLTWESPDTLLLSSSDGIRRTAPCAPPGLASPLPATELAASTTISADGAFAAQTDSLSTEAGVIHLQTTITDRAQQSAVVQVEWSIDERLGDLGLGGEWVGPSTFLLYETLEHGPLLLETTGVVRSVLSDLLGIRSVPSILGPEAYGWIARPSIDTASGSFHLLLSGVGEEARFPLAVLFHAEDGSHETLPYRHPWSDGFAPDGRWLLMDARPDDAGYEAHQVWIRPLDAADGDWTLLADRLDSDLWSLDMASYAWQHGSMVGWRTFPTGDLLGEWNTAPYAARPAMISPDGCRLAAEGNIPGARRSGVFVWDRCSG